MKTVKGMKGDGAALRRTSVWNAVMLRSESVYVGLFGLFFCSYS